MKTVKLTATVILSFLLIIGATLSASAAEYLFKFKDGADFPVAYLREARLQCEDTLSQTLGVYRTEDLDELTEYYETGLLEFFEEDGEVELFAMPKTSDYLNLTSGISSSTVPLGYSYSQIGVDAFWSLGLSGKGITVAVIDSGVTAHKDIIDNLLQGYNYSLTDEEIAANPDAVYVTKDIYKHGTMVAGLIAANGTHYRGIAYEAKILPLKCFKDSTGKADVSALSEAMVDAVDKYGCDIVNMSCGVGTDYLTMRLAMNHVLGKGVPIIASAGNYGNEANETDGYLYPASYPGVVSVANIDKNDVHRSSSNKNDMVDVSAPGTFVYGINGSTTAGYMQYSGTSFSCPMVSGIVALMLEARPDLDDVDIQTLLCATAKDLGEEGKDVRYGYGKVDCEAVVPYLLDGRVYTSKAVLYEGTSNIAIRNGNSESLSDFVAFATYSGGRMTSIELLDRPLAYGESRVFSAATGGEAKLFRLAPQGLSPRTEAVPAESN